MLDMELIMFAVCITLGSYLSKWFHGSPHSIAAPSLVRNAGTSLEELDCLPGLFGHASLRSTCQHYQHSKSFCVRFQWNVLQISVIFGKRHPCVFPWKIVLCPPFQKRWNLVKLCGPPYIPPGPSAPEPRGEGPAWRFPVVKSLDHQNWRKMWIELMI